MVSHFPQKSTSLEYEARAPLSLLYFRGGGGNGGGGDSIFTHVEYLPFVLSLFHSRLYAVQQCVYARACARSSMHTHTHSSKHARTHKKRHNRILLSILWGVRVWARNIYIMSYANMRAQFDVVCARACVRDFCDNCGFGTA